MCTGIRLQAKDKSILFGRTLEFGQTLESNILMLPRNFLYQGLAPEKNKGLSWSGKYAAVGANMFGLNELIDGVNEQGLAAGLFYFPDYAGYQKVTIDEYSLCIAPWQLATFVLSQCASVAEVKKIVSKIKVCQAVFDRLGDVPPVHMIVHDSSGESLVVEYIQGVMHLYDNSVGVITNSPSFDWHITNLKNYLNLTSINHESINLNGVRFPQLGQGTGALGLPGDFTPPSRFVRAVFFSQTAKVGYTADQVRDELFHILNLFDIPVGSVGHLESTGQVEYEHTQWTSISDLTNKRYFWRTYENFQVYMVDLAKMNLDAHSPIMIPMHYQAKIIDVTLKK